MGKSDFREILAVEIISVTGGLLAGVALAFMTDQISLIPGLFILIPGFLEMHNAIDGSVVSRISSGLFLGVIKPKMRGRLIKSNLVATILLVILSSIILGVFAYLASSWFFGIESMKIIFISLIAGIISVITAPFAVFTTIWLFRKGHDPNNIMGPYITSVGDVVGVISFMIAILVVM